ncbi:MAG: alpha/beta fold hydrolase, partial [Myxococcales bacterium]|nr:alpha/beta fold hydrolase [Myxococcales bacterium]
KIVVLPSTSRQPAPDPVFLLAGGPGQGAAAVANFVAGYLEPIRAERDLVFVDLRGTGESHPLACDFEHADDLHELLSAGFVPERLDACLEQYRRDYDSVDLQRYVTDERIDDLDLVRAALGYDQVNLLGISYGTREALVYMRRHPQQVRAAVLDGVAPPDVSVSLAAPAHGEEALRAVLADGTLIRAGAGTSKDVAGLDLKRLLVGSEGTLAVIVEATLRLLPAPRPASTLVASFATLGEAADAIVAMERAGAGSLSLLEFMDRTTVGAVEAMAGMGLDTEAAALVLTQSDAADAVAVIAACEQVCREHGAGEVVISDDPEEGRMLLAARRLALPALERMGTTLLDDVAVPKPALPAMVAAAQEIAARHGLVIGTFGHAGDGNLHPTIVFDAADPRTRAAAQAAFDELLQAAVSLGGSISGEHGIGSLKARLLGQAVGEAEQALMRRIKAAFDPHGILNPGKGY